MYLEVTAIQQAGTEGFKDVRGQEKWMPDNGGSWNGGQWLAEPKAEGVAPPPPPVSRVVTARPR